MELDELAVVLDAEGDGSARRDGHAEVEEPRVVDVEERYAEADLHDLGEVDEVYLRLEGCAAVVGEADDPGEDREVGRLEDLVVGTLDEVLVGAVLLVVDERGDRTVAHAQRGTPADRVLSAVRALL